ncbi:hypothetical protein PR202_gb02542 [Eleusine coracana subsp. coracana]|uniref:Uncharacterized protein n=1 Tax=Eleusine coracana subsp. coracana TaxID=191504 RepID=A0AAV5DZJ8_ELECO|nr:hypothetical protein PR202_gb02542 [Eleusine coracana subsp. coracana]
MFRFDGPRQTFVSGPDTALEPGPQSQKNNHSGPPTTPAAPLLCEPRDVTLRANARRVQSDDTTRAHVPTPAPEPHHPDLTRRPPSSVLLPCFPLLLHLLPASPQSFLPRATPPPPPHRRGTTSRCGGAVAWGAGGLSLGEGPGGPSTAREEEGCNR